jgi:O-antigen/teichoic acid export membrane protein
VEDFGLITASLVLVQVGLTLSTLGSDFTVMRLFYQWSERERRRVAAGVTVLSALWSTALAGALHVGLMATSVAPGTYWTLSLGWWAGLALGVRGVPLSIVRVTGALRPYALFVLGGAALQVTLQVVCVIARLGPAGYMLGYAVGAVVSTAVALIAVRGEYLWSGHVWRLPRATIAYTARILPSVLFSRAVAVSDRLVLAHWGTQETLGLYGAAYRFTTPLRFLSGGFKMAIAPMLSREESSGDADVVFRRMSQLIVLGMLFVGTLVAVAVWFIQFTPWAAASADLQRLVGLLLVAQFMSGLTYLGQVRFYYSPWPGAASVAIAVNAAVLLGALVLLVPRAGAEGAAGAAVLSGLAGLTAVVVLALWQYGRIDPWVRLLALLGTFVPCVVASWVLARGGQLVVFGLTLALYAWSLLVVARRFSRSDVREMYGR